MKTLYNYSLAELNSKYKRAPAVYSETETACPDEADKRTMDPRVKPAGDDGAT